MLVGYRIRSYNELQANTTKYPTASMASSVLADLVGLLTGTITSISGLSVYADPMFCTFSGAQFTWTVYDSDAHPGYSGLGRVLRRLNSDGVTYSYLFIAVYYNSPYLNVCMGTMGGWNSSTKAPTTAMIVNTLGSLAPIAASTVISSANIPLTLASISYYLTDAYAYQRVGFYLLNTQTLFAWTPQADLAGTSTAGNMLVIAEHDNIHPYNNAAAGCPPIIYTTNATSNSPLVRSPFMKNSAGSIIEPTYTFLSCPFGNQRNLNATQPYLNKFIGSLVDRGIDSNGKIASLLIPIDVQPYLSSNGYACYTGRLRSLFATLQNGPGVGDIVPIGGDQYLVIPAVNLGCGDTHVNETAGAVMNLLGKIA